MFVDDLKILEKLNLPIGTKEDAVSCVESKIKYRDNPNEDTLIDLKSTFEVAFTSLKSDKVLGRISPVDYDTVYQIIKKWDEY